MALLSVAITPLFCMTLNAYLEARGEPFYGQIAVNQVALRRAGLNPEGVCAEIYHPHQFIGPWRNPPVKPKRAKAAEWKRAEQAAWAAYVWAAHGIGQDYSGGATHYHAVTARPYWMRCSKLTAQIGRHRFCNDVKPCQKGS